MRCCRICNFAQIGIAEPLFSTPRLGLYSENADPDVQVDMGAIFDRLVKERESYYTHLRGGDDMPTHIKFNIGFR